MTNVNCKTHALDTVDFWTGSRDNFIVYDPITRSGVLIYDRLVRECNPSGKGFDLSAEDTISESRESNCKK